MKGLFWVLTLFGLAVAAAVATGLKDSYVVLVLPSYREEVSLNLVIALLVGGFVILYMLLRGLALATSLPGRVRGYRERRRHAKASGEFEEMIRFVFEGRYAQALKKAGAAHAAGHWPGLAALLAARSAQLLHEPQQQKEWLERAVQSDPKTRSAALMLEAEMLVETRRFDEAVGVLRQLHEIAGVHVAALQLELQAQHGLGQKDEANRIARLLEQRDALPPELARQVGYGEGASGPSA